MRRSVAHLHVVLVGELEVFGLRGLLGEELELRGVELLVGNGGAVLERDVAVERDVHLVGQVDVERAQEGLQLGLVVERTRAQELLAHHFDHRVLELLLEGEVLARRVQLVHQLLPPVAAQQRSVQYSRVE